ncbi:hypothetical protein ABW19_dt0210308 [Dactylella cylindrospora]|nr:hypothetical protein ABW19_dt0210308 [Dactylella cylindrospora]
MDDGTITIIKGDGRLGYSAKAPYDAIHVGAAAKKIHDELVEQLASPGRMFIPVEAGFGDQSIWFVDKDKDGEVKKEKQVSFLCTYIQISPIEVHSMLTAVNCYQSMALCMFHLRTILMKRFWRKQPDWAGRTDWSISIQREIRAHVLYTWRFLCQFFAIAGKKMFEFFFLSL